MAQDPANQSPAMKMPPSPDEGTGIIALTLQNIHQLFNTFDPSPFYEKDLDPDAEEFIISWAREYAHKERLELIIHVRDVPQEEEMREDAIEGVHHFFAEQAELKRRDLRQLFSQGRRSLVVGILFLSACLFASEQVAYLDWVPANSLVRESLIIVGWVAMWGPIEIFLYAWWPIARTRRAFEKLSRAKVTIKQRSDGAAPASPKLV